MFVEMVYHCCKYIGKNVDKYETFKPFFEALLSYEPDKMKMEEYELLNSKLISLEVILQDKNKEMFKEFQSFRRRLFDLWYDSDRIENISFELFPQRFNFHEC